MTAKELIEVLSKVDPDAEIILQKDEEGNGFYPLRIADPNMVYVPESSWDGTIYSLSWTHEDACMDKDE
jgi:hypothetical protein